MNRSIRRALTMSVSAIILLSSFSCNLPHINLEYLGTFAVPPLAIAKEQIAAGTNLNGVNDWTDEVPFKDFVKIARPWNNEDSSGLTLDDNGWVTSLGSNSRALLLWDAPISNPSGDFVCLYDGDGDIYVNSPYNFITVTSSSPGRIEFSVDQAVRESAGRGYWELVITRTNPANYIRNIRIIKKEYESNYLSDPWTPEFIENITDRFNTLRFMDWQATNNSGTVDWDEMRSRDFYTQNSGNTGKSASVSLEYMVDLCNATDSNGWFCIPHRATDDYIRQFATYVYQNMEPGLKVYIEYSNECWNWQFIQTTYCHDQGVAQNLDPDEWVAWRGFYAKRSIEMFHIFEEVFGGQTNRLVRVLASQGAYYNMTNLVLNYIYPDGTGNKAASHADALAIAPYFGGEAHDQQGSRNWSLDQLFDYMDYQVNDPGTPGQGDTVRRWMIDNYDYFIKPNPNLRLIAYEGGQHLLPLTNGAYDESKNDLYMAAQNDPRMKTLYKQYLSHWREAGGQMFVLFSSVGNWGRYGYWGLIENYRSIGTPKYSGTIEWINENPRWW